MACGACITACTYGAIEFHDTPHGKKARVNPILCKGDGLCNAKCPTAAIYLKHYTDEEILCQIDAAVPHATRLLRAAPRPAADRWRIAAQRRREMGGR